MPTRTAMSLIPALAYPFSMNTCLAACMIRCSILVFSVAPMIIILKVIDEQQQAVGDVHAADAAVEVQR